MNGTDFQQLVDQQYAPLYRFALSLAKSEPDAADLTQQTFFLWASKGGRMRDGSKAKSWLFTTLYREFLNRRRHDGRFPKVQLDDAPEEEISIIQNMNELDGAYVVKALGEVEEPFRAALTLFYLDQFSYHEIAEVLEVPIGTVMSRLSRGKAQLRQRLRPEEQVLGNRIVSFGSHKKEDQRG